jgi:hypothetical protein
MALTKNKHRRNRRKQQLGTAPAQAFATAVVSGTGSTLTIDTDIAIALQGILPLVTVATRSMVSAIQNTATQVAILFSGTVATLDWEIKENDPAMRTGTGGFVTAQCGTFP